MDAETLASKLTGDAAESLATLLVERAFAAPFESWGASVDWASWTRRFLDGWLSSDSAVEEMNHVVEACVAMMQRDNRSLAAWLGPDMRAALRAVISRPISPNRQLVLRIIDRKPTRDLVRQLLLETVLDFTKKASAPVAGMAKGLGSLARLASETVKSRGGSLGHMVGAVSGEVERQLERRAIEFVDSALAGVLSQLADVVANPQRAAEAAELRLALFDGFAEATGPQLAYELINVDAAGAAVTLRQALLRWLSTPASDEALKVWADALVALVRQRTLGEVLARLGVLVPARAFGVAQLAVQIRELAKSEAFVVWLRETMEN